MVPIAPMSTFGAADHSYGEARMHMHHDTFTPSLEGHRDPGSILVVDDDNGVRGFLVALLGHAGYRAVGASSLAEARTIIAAQQHDVISVLLDNHLPDGTGVELLRELRAAPASATVPVIVITGETSTEAEVRGLEAGATDFVTKPVDSEALLARIASRLRDRAAWLALADVVATTGNGERDLHTQRAAIEETIERAAFETCFQSVVGLADAQAVGAEALTRFADGTPPDERFPIASATGLGLDLELATLQSAIRSARRLPGPGFLSLNVSPGILRDRARELEALLDGTSRQVVLEITEREAIDDYASVRDAVSSLGPSVHLSIDDAGAGFASLRHVVMLEPDYVKLDRSWTAELDDSPSHQAMVAGLVHFAGTTGCRLVAEGIETASQRDILLDLGVELGQGYLFGRPAPAVQLN